MKPIASIVGMGLLGGLMISSPPSVPADLEVSASLQIHSTADFEAPLSGHGHWQLVQGYGRCWQPTGIPTNWRPYCIGYWVWTDCGWYWNSDEPWAWACYHYGAWAFDSRLGWFWVPDIEWSPAWVHWRVGGGYVGWAPRAPRGVIVATDLFAFVPSARLQEHVRLSTVVVNDAAVINKTAPLSGVRRVERNIGGIQQKVFVNQGPEASVIQKATGTKLRPLAIEEAVRQTTLPPPSPHGTKPAIGSPGKRPGQADDGSAEPRPRNTKDDQKSKKKNHGGGPHGKGK